MLAVELKHRLSCPWNKATGPFSQTFGGDQPDDPPRVPTAPATYDLAFSPDSRLVAASRNDRTILIWDVETGERVREFSVDYTPYRISFTRDSERVLLCCKTKVIEEWSLKEARRLRVLKRKVAHGVCGAFSPDGIHVAVAGGPKKVAIFELEHGAELDPLTTSHGASVVNFSPSGRLVAVGVLQTKDALTVWEFHTRRVKFSILPGRGGSASVVFSPDESLVAYSGFFDGSVTLWNAETGAFHSCVRQPGGRGRHVAFHREGRDLFVLEDGRISVLELASGRETRCEPAHAGAHLLAASPDGRFLATGGLDDRIVLWKIG